MADNDADADSAIWQYSVTETANKRIIFFERNSSSTSQCLQSNEYPKSGSIHFKVEIAHSEYDDIAVKFWFWRSLGREHSTKCESIYYVFNRLNVMSTITHVNEGRVNLKPLWYQEVGSWRPLEFNLKSFRLIIEVNVSDDVDIIYDLKPPCQRLITSLYEDTVHADFKLVSDDGSCVEVHKTVLAGRSPVLARMLAGEWKESQENELKVVGSNAEMLSDLKKSLYLIEVPEDNLHFHMEFATLYEIESMQTLVLQALCNNLTVKDTAHDLAFARRINYKPLIEAVSNFMLENSQKLVEALLNDTIENLTIV